MVRHGLQRIDPPPPRPETSSQPGHAARIAAEYPRTRRRRPESNRCARLCRPLPNHSATSPEVTRLSAGLRATTRRLRPHGRPGARRFAAQGRPGLPPPPARAWARSENESHTTTSSAPLTGTTAVTAGSADASAAGPGRFATSTSSTSSRRGYPARTAAIAIARTAASPVEASTRLRPLAGSAGTTNCRCTRPGEAARHVRQVSGHRGDRRVGGGHRGDLEQRVRDRRRPSLRLEQPCVLERHGGLRSQQLQQPHR